LAVWTARPDIRMVITLLDDKECLLLGAGNDDLVGNRCCVRRLICACKAASVGSGRPMMMKQRLNNGGGTQNTAKRGEGAGAKRAKATRRPAPGFQGRAERRGAARQLPREFFQTGSTRYRMPAMTMQTGMVSTQAMTMLPTIPHLRA